MASQTSKTQVASERQSAKQRPAAAAAQKIVAPAALADHLQRAVADPGAARPADILMLQRRYGNQSVQRLLARRALQAKLTVGPAGDAYEQEADRVADQVMVMPASSPDRHQPAVQRQAEDEDELQAKPVAASITPLIQRQELSEEEEIQAKPLIQRAPEEEAAVQGKRVAGAGFEAGRAMEDQLRAQKSSGSALPGDVRAYMEPRFGADFSEVRVHTDGPAAQLNRQLSAQAFTQGQDIYLGEGRYSPGSTEGKRLLAHELTHTLQQGAARLSPRTLLAVKRQAARPQLQKLPGEIQRYVAINPQDYTMQAGAKFASQSIETGRGHSAYVMETKEMTTGGSLKYTKQKKGKKGFDVVRRGTSAKPTINYASDGAAKAIALERTTAEPKVFYATPAVKAESNTKLAEVGSAVRIETAGETLTAPKDPNDLAAGTLSLQMMQPAADEGEPNKFKILDKFGEISECNAFIKYILGSMGERVGVFGQGGGEKEAIVSEEHEPTHEIADFASTQPAGNASALAAHLKGTPTGSHDTALPAAYTTMPNKAVRDQQLGINTGALAEVGEGYVTTSNTPMPGNVPYDQYLAGLGKLKAGTPLTPDEEKIFTYKWGYHYAGIVARVNNDAISLENYNRGTVMEWELDKHYNDLVFQYQAFRDFVQAFVSAEQLAGRPGVIPSIPKLRRAWFKQRAQAWEKSIKEAGRQNEAINQQIAKALDRINKTQSEGMAVANAKLFHFKMYGDAPGQSFHEQWQGALSDSMTLRIRQSVDALRDTGLEKLDAKCALLEQSDDLPNSLAAVLPTVKANVARKLQQATTSSQVSEILTFAVGYLKGMHWQAIRQMARQVAELSGVSPDQVPTQLNSDALLKLIDRWIAKGWAVRKESKEKLVTRRAQQQELRRHIAGLIAIHLD